MAVVQKCFQGYKCKYPTSPFYLYLTRYLFINHTDSLESGHISNFTHDIVHSLDTYLVNIFQGFTLLPSYGYTVVSLVFKTQQAQSPWITLPCTLTFNPCFPYSGHKYGNAPTNFFYILMQQGYFHKF